MKLLLAILLLSTANPLQVEAADKKPALLELKSGDHRLAIENLKGAYYVVTEKDEVIALPVAFRAEDTKKLEAFTKPLLQKLVTISIDGEKVSEAALMSKLSTALQIDLEKKLTDQQEQALLKDFRDKKLPRVPSAHPVRTPENAEDAIEALLDVFDKKPKPPNKARLDNPLPRRESEIEP